jgi:hypothetical protein
VALMRAATHWGYHCQANKYGLPSVAASGSAGMLQAMEIVRMHTLPPSLRIWFVLVDTGFILYWLITLVGLIPAEYLFKDYENPILMAWNWSFLPLDLLISASGLAAIAISKRANRNAIPLAIVSLVLTSCSGLMAISFWVLRSDYAFSWWLPNLVLLIYPLFYLRSLV